jgi:phospholipase/lecithinase/hemolysin
MLPTRSRALAILNNAVAAMVDAIVTLRNAGCENVSHHEWANAGLSPAVRILDVLQPGTAAAAAHGDHHLQRPAGRSTRPAPAGAGDHHRSVRRSCLFQDLVANPGAAGLENVTDACLTPDTAPFVCRTPDRYLYWDGVHPTAAVHALVAGAVAALLGF